MVHHEEGHAEHARVVFGPTQPRHGDTGDALESGENLTLEPEVRLEEEGVAGRMDPEDQSMRCLDAIFPPLSPQEDCLV